MGVVIFLGCLMTIFAPALAVFLTLTTKSAQLTICTAGSAFFWLLSAILSSLIWTIVPPLQGWYLWAIPWKVASEELCRYAFFRLYNKADAGFEKFAAQVPNAKKMNFYSAALSSGVGYGVSSVLITYVPTLTESLGPGTYYLSSCPSVNYFILISFIGMFNIILQPFLNIIAFEGYKRKSKPKILFVWLSHLAFSLLTLFNLPNGSCIASLLSLFTVDCIVGFVACSILKVYWYR